MASKVLLVHGGGGHPAADVLQDLWAAALRTGVARDHKKALATLDAAELALYYYGDWTTSFHDDFAIASDLEDQQKCLATLATLAKSKDFRRRHYDTLPGKSAAPEFFMDAGASLGIGGMLISRKLPELKAYWSDPTLQQARMADLARWISGHLESGQPVALMSHCVGNVLVYDALWHLSHEHNAQYETPLTWISLGSPLASNSVRKRLKGAREPERKRYPTMVQRWLNIAAEDDPVCHDKSVADDFRPMTSETTQIEDRVIYNLAQRYDRSAPHDAIGYLVHPAVANAIVEVCR